MTDRNGYGVIIDPVGRRLGSDKFFQKDFTSLAHNWSTQYRALPNFDQDIKLAHSALEKYTSKYYLQYNKGLYTVRLENREASSKVSLENAIRLALAKEIIFCQKL